MKKLSLLFSSIILLFATSCSMEEFENSASGGDLNNGSGRSSAKFAGDGAYDVLGYGYNATGEYANSNSAGYQVIDIERFKNEQAGRLITDNVFSQEFLEEYGEHAEAYSKMVSTKVGATAGFSLFKKLISVSFSSSVVNNTSNKFDAKYIYGSYNLLIKQRRFRFNATPTLLSDYLTPEFINDLQSNKPEQIVNDYGTHVAIDIFTGAKLDVMFQSETTNENREKAARVGVKVGVKKILDVDVQNNVDTSESDKNYSRKLTFKTRGGDPSKGLVGTLDLEIANPKINITNWQNSSTPANAVLVEFGSNGLIPLYEFIKDPVKKAEMKAYIDKYLIDNQVRLTYTNSANLVNGNFVRNPVTNQIFFMFENKLRYIQSPMTLYGLFNITSGEIATISPSHLSTVERGADLTPDNDLKQDIYTNKIYMREGNVLRYIPNLAVYNKYRFNNSAVKKIYGTSGYVIGSNIQ
ncbi:MAC/perforin domain-containing protein [Chryseobacterium bernardetii]|uniref:MACPF domain-containing protein n=1 Tax=Chryseobacterium bernardetii TaxID=1241978 RepID=A0A3G6U0S3_9FLAO|nr:MAC/perforin domain-containing protein [Chryseobacterium bernardetii]AZB24502.1 hypothetical protein EG339_07730 [Chryseobacterium bernardetii]AZB35085.1 hypothetical protein EG351_16640 [Chryseobacterium bernardetii]